MTRTIRMVLGLAAGLLPVLASADAPDSITAPITCVIIAPDGNSVLDSSQAGIRIRNWDGLKIERELPPPCSQIHDLKLAPNGSMLVVAGGDPGLGAVVTAYTWPDLKLMWSSEFSEDVAYAADFSADSSVLAVGAHDHQIYQLDPTSGTVLSSLSGHSKPVTGVVFLPDGETLISCSRDQAIRVWNRQSGKIVRSLTNHTQPVTGVSLCIGVKSGLPLIVSAGEDKTVRLWQPTIGRMLRFKRFDTPANAAAFDATGRMLVVGGRDGTVRLVRVDTLETRQISVLEDGWINSVAVHPRENVAIAGCSDGTVRKLDLAADGDE